jgi:hypothetical protein
LKMKKTSERSIPRFGCADADNRHKDTLATMRAGKARGAPACGASRGQENGVMGARSRRDR